jgi:uncharacterized peroxidase-related enzyme
MPHIALPAGLAGIRGPMAFRPETAMPLMALANALLRDASPLSRAERELIAAYVSAGNGCKFCCQSHAAVARAHFGAEAGLVDATLADVASAPLPPKLRALLGVADQVRIGGKSVDDESIARAKAAGATDVELHDTVLIAAAFCMFNRYVDGLATRYSDDPTAFAAMGALLAQNGYVR